MNLDERGGRETQHHARRTAAPARAPALPRYSVQQYARNDDVYGTLVRAQSAST